MKVVQGFFAALWLLAMPLAAQDVSAFLQARAGLTQGTDPAPDRLGLSLAHVRIRYTAPAAPGVQVAIMPELAGGFGLLDAYADWTIMDGGLSLRVGQFKFPFGQDRMPGPQALERADYSAVNAALFPGSAWDVGSMATLKAAGLDLAVAVIEGQGANLAAASAGSRGRKDFSARLQWSSTEGGLVLGASLYQGLSHKTPWAPTPPPPSVTWGPNHTWSGAHLAVKTERLGLKAEYIGRDDLLWGVTVEPRVALGGGLSLVAYYDRVENQALASAAATAMGGALAWRFAPELELTLDGRGTASGPDQKPTATQIQLQYQVGF
jgi:hypothetical protein